MYKAVIERVETKPIGSLSLYNGEELIAVLDSSKSFMELNEEK